MVLSRVLRRVPAAVLSVTLLVAVSCGVPHVWTDMALRAPGDLPRPVGSTVIDVTCGQENTCLVVQEITGQVTTSVLAWNGLGWLPAVAPASSLRRVSCVTATNCAGITDEGVAGWDGTRWQSVTAAALWGEPLPGYARAVSCGYRGCVATDSGRTAVWDGQRWAASPATVEARALSCVSINYCLAAGGSGAVSEWNGTTWSVVHRISHPGDGVNIVAVSCWETKACAIAGATPTMPTPVDPQPTGNAFLSYWDGTAMTEGIGVPGARDLACTVPKRCIIVRGALPPVVTSESERREPPVPPVLGDTTPELNTVTCALTMCVAAGHTGEGTTARPVAYRWNFQPVR